MTRITAPPRNSGQYTGHCRAIRVSRILKPKAPASGPKNDWTPPSRATTRGSKDLFRKAKSGKTLPLKKAKSPPASPEKNPERTKAMSWWRRTFTPMKRARRGFSRMALRA